MSSGLHLDPRVWVTHQLHKGDLTALAALADGDGDGKLDKDRIGRLARRGFIAIQPSGRSHITPRGRIALVLRRLLPH